jgi:hypothetical protein
MISNVRYKRILEASHDAYPIGPPEAAEEEAKRRRSGGTRARRSSQHLKDIGALE